MAPREMDSSATDEGTLSESTRLLSNDETTSSENDAKRDDDSEELPRTVFILSFALVVQSYLLVSVFPYSGFLAIHLIPGLNEETAGRYAGLIASSFMAGRTFTSFQWGKAADKYGRVAVIKASMLLSAIFSILFGVATTFPMALTFRCLLGLSNGFMGPIKTLVSEYAQGDKKKETKMMAMILGMWGYGFLINPAISGFLSDPIQQYPDSEFVQIFRPIFEKFPFILPNLVGCLFCLIGYVLMHNFVEETLPEEKREEFRLGKTIMGLLKRLQKSDQEERRLENDGEEAVTISSLMKRQGTRDHLFVYWGYSFMLITLDELFPLYCMSKTTGLGITEKTIGKIFTWGGLLYVCVQYFVTTIIVDACGYYKALRLGTLLSMPLAFFIPISLITNQGAEDGTLTLTSFLFLGIIFAAIRSFSSIVFSTISMLLNRTVPDDQRASMNGLSMLGGSLAKALGPLFGGILFSTSAVNVTPPFGSVVVYSTTTFLGLCLAVGAYFLREYDGHEQDSTKATKDKGEEPPTV